MLALVSSSFLASLEWCQQMADGKLLALPFQAAATTTALATKFGADITVVGKYLDRVSSPPSSEVKLTETLANILCCLELQLFFLLTMFYFGLFFQ
jgi:hypothetical protein